MRRRRGALRAIRLSRIATALVLVLGLTMIPGSAMAERTIALSSGTFAFEVEPGDSGEGEVIVMNDGDEPLKALVYITDVQVDDSGKQEFVVPQRQGASILTTPASWFRIFMPADSKAVGNTPYLELDVGERVPIQFAFSPPQGVPSGDHNVVIFFEMFELLQGNEGAAAQVSGRLGARVALRVIGPVIENLTIRPFDVPSFRIGNAVPFTFTVNNAGNTNKRVAVAAELLDRSERSVVASVVASDTAVLADSRYRFEGALNTGAGRFGPHTLEVRVRYFLEDAVTPTELIEQRTVWLLPMWVLLVLAFVLFDLLVWAAVRTYRSRRRAPGPSAPPGDVSPPRAARTTETSSASPPPLSVTDQPAVTPHVDAAGREAGASFGRSVAREEGRASRHQRASRKELRLEAEERRRRREQRAAEDARYGGGLPGRDGPLADSEGDRPE